MTPIGVKKMYNLVHLDIGYRNNKNARAFNKFVAIEVVAPIRQNRHRDRNVSYDVSGPFEVKNL